MYDTVRTFDGNHLRYKTSFNETQNNGKVLVIVHGMTQRIETFGLIVENLLPHYEKIYQYDLRGHGESYRPVKDATHFDRFEDHVEDLCYVMESLVYPNNMDKEIHLMSHSFGGAIASYYLGGCEHQVDKAILSSPALSFHSAPFSPFGFRYFCDRRMYGNKLLNYFGAVSMCLVGRGDTAYPDFAIRTIASNYLDWRVPLKEAYGAGAEETSDEEMYKYMYNQFLQFNENKKYRLMTARTLSKWVVAEPKIQRLFSQIDIPTLVLYAQNDYFTDEKMTEQQASDSMRLISFDSKHFIPMEVSSIRNVWYREVLNFI